MRAAIRSLCFAFELRSPEDIKRVLDDVRASCDLAARRESDPVGIVHEHADLEDREIVGLVAALVAFGNVKTIRSNGIWKNWNEKNFSVETSPLFLSLRRRERHSTAVSVPE